MPKASTSISPNVPAFQRKRSLSAKARRVQKPATALERRSAGVSVVKPKRVRRARPRASSEGFNGGFDGGFSAPVIEDVYEPISVSSSGSGPREMHLCGVTEAFFDKIDVVAIQVSSSVRVGDRLVFETQYGLFEQEIESMQINREDVMTAYNGDDIGVKILAEPKKGGNVYKVI